MSRIPNDKIKRYCHQKRKPKPKILSTSTPINKFHRGLPRYQIIRSKGKVTRKPSDGSTAVSDW